MLGMAMLGILDQFKGLFGWKSSPTTVLTEVEKLTKRQGGLGGFVPSATYTQTVNAPKVFPVFQPYRKVRISRVDFVPHTAYASSTVTKSSAGNKLNLVATKVQTGTGTTDTTTSSFSDNVGKIKAADGPQALVIGTRLPLLTADSAFDMNADGKLTLDVSEIGTAAVPLDGHLEVEWEEAT